MTKNNPIYHVAFSHIKPFTGGQHPPSHSSEERIFPFSNNQVYLKVIGLEEEEEKRIPFVKSKYSSTSGHIDTYMHSKECCPSAAAAASYQ